MKLLAQNQLIGTSAGSAVFRDLFETEDGKRVSVPTSREFCMMKERTLPNGSLLPSYDVPSIFDKYRLN